VARREDGSEEEGACGRKGGRVRGREGGREGGRKGGRRGNGKKRPFTA